MLRYKEDTISMTLILFEVLRSIRKVFGREPPLFLTTTRAQEVTEYSSPRRRKDGTPFARCQRGPEPYTIVLGPKRMASSCSKEPFCFLDSSTELRNRLYDFYFFGGEDDVPVLYLYYDRLHQDLRTTHLGIEDKGSRKAITARR